MRLFVYLVIIIQSALMPLYSVPEIKLDKLTFVELKYFNVYPVDSHENSLKDKNPAGKELINLRTYNKNKKKVIWIQKTFRLSGEKNEFDNIVLDFCNISTAYDVYWDGECIGNNGRISDNGKVIKPGTFLYSINLKDGIVSEGIHTLSIKLLFDPLPFDRSRAVRLGYKNIIQGLIYNNHLKNRYWLGFMSVLAFVCMALYFAGNKNPSYLFFGIYSGSLNLRSLWRYFISNNEVSTALYKFPFPIYIFSDEILALVLVLFLLWHFKVEEKKKYIILLISLLFIVIILRYLFFQSIEFYGYFFIVPFHLIAIYICFKSALNKTPGSLIALLSFSVFTTSGIINYFTQPGFISSNISYFISLFYLTLLLSVIIKIQSENKVANDMMIRSKRLETELLKRSIQPHFILNTLLSLKSLIASGGNKAEKLIDSLAEEFNIIREISSETKIRIKRELDLCRLHLRIMGFRRAAEYKLNSDCSYNHALIPPLILHTLIENGITHSFKPEEDGTFTFRCFKIESKLKLVLGNNGSQILKKSLDETPLIEEGTGIKYIRTRLNEVFGNNWSLEYGIKGEHWIVEITIPFDEIK